MTEAADLPAARPTSEEQMFEKAECRDCGVKHFDDARAWAHQHARETGHAVQLHFGYDVRPEDWMTGLSPERLVEFEALRTDPKRARALAKQLLRDSSGSKTH